MNGSIPRGKRVREDAKAADDAKRTNRSKREEPITYWTATRGMLDIADLYENRTDDGARILRALEDRRREARRLAFGVPYQWITEPAPDAEYHWFAHDHYFEGASAAELKRIQKEEGAKSLVEREDADDSIIRCADDGKRFPKSGLPSAKEMQGAYDIVFYAAEYMYEVRHHRTARGSLVLSAVPLDLFVETYSLNLFE